MFNLSKGAKKAIKILNEAGYEAYLVGGSIRDAIMNNPVSDFDITTNATPEEMKKSFKGERIIETGIQHGTLTFVFDKENIEITTYRVDGEYTDNRHPEEVKFTKRLQDDLSRRDFTMNAIAYDPISNTLVDLFGGKEDIENKTVRAIGDPEKRFTEDALRILRAIRFSSTLGFIIEEKTKRAMLKCAHLLENISKERIATELNKFLCGKNVKNAILENYEILSYIVPEIKEMHGFDQRNVWHIYDILTHTAVVVENMPPVPHMRLIGFLHDIGKVHTFTVDENGVGHFPGHNGVSAERARAFFNEYKYDTFTKNRVCDIIAVHDAKIADTKACVKRWLNRMGYEAFSELLLMKRADNIAQNPKMVNMEQLDRLNAILNEIIEEQACFSLKDLRVNGSDLIENGFEKGKKIGEILDFLLNEVIEEKTENEKSSLLKRARERFGG